MAKKAGMATGVEVARISVKVSPNSREFRRELQRDLDAIESSVKAKIDVEPNMNGFREEVKAKTSGMKTKVKVDAEVDRGFFSRITDSLSKIEGPNFGSGINLAGYGVILAGILALAAPLMGVITTALLSLPGLLAAVIAPIGAITLGLDGIKEAASVLEAPFEDLKATMSAVNQAAFTPVFEKLGAVFPVLERSLPRVSEGLAAMADSFVTALTSSPKLENSINNIGEALKQASPGIGSFTDGLLGLVESFTGKPLSDLVGWFNDTGQSFQNWVEKMTRPDWFTGKSPLETAFEGLGDTLKPIIDLIGELGSEGMDFMSDPQKVEDFKNGLKEVADLIDDIVEASNKLNEIDLFSNMIPDFDMGRFKEDVLTPFTSEDAGWRGIWADIKAGAQEAYQSVTSTFSQMGSDIANVASSIGGAFSNAWNGVVSAAQSAWNSVIGAVQSAWEGIKGAVQSGISAVLGFVSNMGSEIISSITSIDLGSAGRAIMDGFLGGLTAGFEKVKGFVSGIAGWIADHKGPIDYDKKVLIPNGEALMQGLGKGLENGFQPVLDQAKGMAQQIADAFASGQDPTGILSGFSKQEIDRIEKVLSLESKRLTNQAKALEYQAKMTDNDALKAEADRLRMLKDEIGLQREMLGLTQDYSDELGSAGGGDDPLVKAASGLMNAPVDFAKATGKQFLSDLGVSGDGLIGRALTEGIQYIFQIGSVDEALSIKDREESKQALSVVGRT